MVPDERHRSSGRGTPAGLPENCPFLTISADTAGHGRALLGVVQRRPGEHARGDDPARRDAAAGDRRRAGASPDQGGWYNRAVAVAFTGSDATSGIASCTTPQYAGPDGASREVSGTCTDAAGNTSAAAVMTLKYDATPPAGPAAPARDPDRTAGSTTRSRSSATDPTRVSGVASCSSQTYSGPDSAAASVKATCTDNAGNTSAPVETTLKYDATDPAISAKVDRGPGPQRLVPASGQGDVQRRTDETSGVAACTGPAAYKGPTTRTATLAGTCRDAAGNTSETAFDFKYDDTAPKLTRARGHERERAHHASVEAHRRARSRSSSCAAPA